MEFVGQHHIFFFTLEGSLGVRETIVVMVVIVVVVVNGFCRPTSYFLLHTWRVSGCDRDHCGNIRSGCGVHFYRQESNVHPGLRTNEGANGRMSPARAKFALIFSAASKMK